MEENEKAVSSGKKVKTFLTVVFAAGFIAMTAFFVYEYSQGRFKSEENLQEYIASFGIYGPLILTFFQCIKVVYTVIPGALGCIVGATLFGTVKGFICSYIGICTGSLLAFTLSRKFGVSFVSSLMGEKHYNKCIKWLNRNRKNYSLFLWVAITFPFSPDDFLCYFSGLTHLSYKRFMIIILTAKPWTILAYSLIFGYLGKTV
ncbi:MAG: VTT domain-containing protein [Spirochaetales bacterium]|nr:VTT domain-containing protein [Spirochaetales bacterium]